MIAVGDYYSQSHYSLASQADHILLHPEGAVEVSLLLSTGIGVRQLLENVYLTMDVRVGENKSAVARANKRERERERERERVAQWLGDV